MCDEGFDSSDWDTSDVSDTSDYDVDDSIGDSDVDVEIDEPADLDAGDVDTDADIAYDNDPDTNYDMDVEPSLDPAEDVDYDLDQVADLDLDAADLSDTDLSTDDVGEGEDFSDVAELEEEASPADVPVPLTVDDITDEMLEAYMAAEQEALDDTGDAESGDDVKVLRRDPDELMEIGMSNVEDILDVRRDDMLDKGMEEEEIEEALAQEREQLQQEFVQDAFPEAIEDVEGISSSSEVEEFPTKEDDVDLVEEESMVDLPDEDVSDDVFADEELMEQEENFGDETDVAEIAEEYEPQEDLDAGTENESIDLTEPEDGPLDAAEDAEDSADENFDLADMQPNPQEEREELGELDNAEEIKDTSELDEESPEPNDWMRDLATQNVQADRLPATGGEWSDPEREGDSEWQLDDTTEIQWRHGGETHTMTGAEFKERYGVEGVEYKNGEPDFEPFEDDLIGSVQLEDLPTQRGGRDGSYVIASQLAAEKLGITADEVTEYMREKGLTWHECGDCKTMRAIPTEVNAAFPHTGGISIRRSVRAVAEGISDTYGEVSLSRSEMGGAADMKEIESAQKENKTLYRKYKS